MPGLCDPQDDDFLYAADFFDTCGSDVRSQKISRQLAYMIFMPHRYPHNEENSWPFHILLLACIWIPAITMVCVTTPNGTTTFRRILHWTYMLPTFVVVIFEVMIVGPAPLMLLSIEIYTLLYWTRYYWMAWLRQWFTNSRDLDFMTRIQDSLE